MIENLLYLIVGFAVTYLSLEVAWHFTACKIKESSGITPCFFKEVKTILAAPLETRGDRVY
jgi:hypothetical protein